MGYTARSLYGVVGLARPDVDDAVLSVCIQEAVKEVCRRTMLARQTLEYSLAASDNSVVVSPSWGELVKVMDVIWKADTDTDWSNSLEEVSFEDAQEWGYWKMDGIPTAFSQQQGIVIVYPAPNVSGSIRVVTSYSPSTDVTTVPLPESAKSAVQLKAESMLLKVPGPAMNLKFAVDREIEYKRCINNLRAISLYGEGGDIAVQTTLPY